MSITLANLKTRTLNKLQDYLQEGSTTYIVTAEQNTTKRFKLPKEHLVSGSVTLTLDGAAQTNPTHYTVDLDSGWITFVTAPGTDKVIAVVYQYRLFSDTDLTRAINQGLRHAWPYLPIRGVDTSLTGNATAQEYALPADVAYIERLESSYDGGSTWSREFDWTTYEAWDTATSVEKRWLRFLSSAPIGKLRLRYVRAFVEMVSSTDEMQKDAHIKEAASEPVVYYACWQLLYEQIIRRQREVAFLNDEPPNVPKVYEGMRFADGLRASCDGMLNEYRATPRLKGI